MFFQPASVLPLSPLQFFIYKLTYTMLDRQLIQCFNQYMNTYKKKPVEIEANQVKREGLSGIQTAEWMIENGYPWLVGNALYPELLRDPNIEDKDHIPTKGIWIEPESGSLMIRTLEGDMRVTVGDYVIKGVQGEFYPCKPDIFEATYDKVEK